MEILFCVFCAKDGVSVVVGAVLLLSSTSSRCSIRSTLCVVTVTEDVRFGAMECILITVFQYPGFFLRVSMQRVKPFFF
jgi:hypothetical protein